MLSHTRMRQFTLRRTITQHSADNWEQETSCLSRTLSSLTFINDTSLSTSHQITTRNANCQSILLNRCRTLVLTTDDISKERIGNCLFRKLHDGIWNIFSTHFYMNRIVLCMIRKIQTNCIEVDSFSNMFRRIKQLLLHQTRRIHASMKTEFIYHITPSTRQTTWFRISLQNIPTTCPLLISGVARLVIVLSRMNTSLISCGRIATITITTVSVASEIARIVPIS